MAGSDMTDQDWERLTRIVERSNGVVQLDTDELGTCVILEGFGVFHPSSFLELMDSCAQSAGVFL